MPDVPEWPLPPIVDDEGKFIIDDHFTGEEHLYLRVQAQHIPNINVSCPDEELILSPTAILYPDFSVNRENTVGQQMSLKGMMVLA